MSEESVEAAVETVGSEAPNEAVEQNTTTTDAPESTDQTAQNDDFVPFPKKAQNALARRDRQIKKMHAQLAQYQTEMENLRKSIQQGAPEDKGPKESDFETYGEFLKAQTLWEVKKEMAESQKAASEKMQSEQQNAAKAHFVEQRVQAIAVKSQEYAKKFPDFLQVAQANAAFLDALPTEVQEAFYNPRIDAALAFYNLAKAGRLDDIADMSRDEALILLAQAQSLPAPTTKAPAPMKAASGTGSPVNGDLANDPTAMRKWLEKRR